jgi:hypothetical protein
LSKLVKVRIVEVLLKIYSGKPQQSAIPLLLQGRRQNAVSCTTGKQLNQFCSAWPQLSFSVFQLDQYMDRPVVAQIYISLSQRSVANEKTCHRNFL